METPPKTWPVGELRITVLYLTEGSARIWVTGTLSLLPPEPSAEREQRFV